MALGYPEQDVYVETAKNAPTVKRLRTVQAENPELVAKELRHMAYSAATPQPHDLSGDEAGEIPKGKKFPIWFQTWTHGYGHGTFAVQSGTASLNIRFLDLMRGGKYSLWCGTEHAGTITQKPCDESLPLFEADGKGRGTLKVSFPAPPNSTAQTGSWLMLAYHSDGHDKPLKQDFGVTTHVQTVYRVPTAKELLPAY